MPDGKQASNWIECREVLTLMIGGRCPPSAPGLARSAFVSVPAARLELFKPLHSRMLSTCYTRSIRRRDKQLRGRVGKFSLASLVAFAARAGLSVHLEITLAA